MRTLLALAAAAALAAAPAAAQVVTGRVVAAEDGSPVANVIVRLVPTGGGDPAAVWVDEQGRFALLAPGQGGYRVTAARVGFRETVSAPVELGETDSLDVLVRLSREAVVLDPIRAVAMRRPPARLRGFYERMEARGFGWFLTRDQIERRSPLRATDLLRGARGVYVGSSGRGLEGSLRGVGGCMPAIYLDGMRIASLDAVVAPESVEGIEVYPGGTAPVEYAGPSASCAVVLVWTRG